MKPGGTRTAPELLLAETLLAVGEPDTADQHYRSVLAREPDNPRPSFRPGAARPLPRRVGEQPHPIAPVPGQSVRAKEGLYSSLAAVCRASGDTASADEYRTGPTTCRRTPTGRIPSSRTTCDGP